MLYDSSLWCRGLVCIVWLWYFQIMLTYFCDYTISWPIVTLWNLESWSRERLLMKRQTDNHLPGPVGWKGWYIVLWIISLADTFVLCDISRAGTFYFVIISLADTCLLLDISRAGTWYFVIIPLADTFVLWDISRAGTLFFMIISLSDTFVLLISPELAHCTLWLYR